MACKNNTENSETTCNEHGAATITLSEGIEEIREDCRRLMLNSPIWSVLCAILLR